MIYIILAWFFWFLFCFNIGFFVLNKILAKKHFEVGLFYNFWFGLFILLILLQIISIFHSLNGVVLLSLSFLNLLIFFYNIKNLSKGYKNIFKKELAYLLDYRRILTFSTLALFLSFLSNIPVSWYDTHLYHLNSVRWIADYGTVKGLANLHTRLGVNNITFLLAAIMDNGIFNSSSSHILNSFLVFVFSVQLILFLLKNWGKNNFINLFVLFSLLILSMYTGQVNSLSTDFGLVVFVLVSSFYTLVFDRNYLVFAVPLYILAATTKFSYFPALLIFIMFVIFWLKNRVLLRPNLFIFLFAVIFFLGFAARNILLSGWPFFPLPILGVDVAWRVPADVVNDFNNVVKSWARLPGPKHWTSLNLNFWDWFMNWFTNNKGDPMTYYLFTLIILTFVYLFYRNNRGNNLSKKERLDLLFLISIASIFYVFKKAPDFRFMSIFVLLAISLILTSLLFNVLFSNLLKDLTLVVFMFLISFYLLKSIRFEKEPTLFVIEKEGSGLVEPKDLRYSDQSFYFWTPVNGDQCGNSQLPCTPYVTGFKMFEPGNIKAGFYFTNETSSYR